MSRRPQTASVLVIVLVTIVFASAALLAFVERASDELILPTRQTSANRLRAEAYSALDTTLAVLVDFKAVNGTLRSPAEGWNNPLGPDWGNYTPTEGRSVTVTFEDESGKMSLPNATPQNVLDLFTYWNADPTLAAQFTDSLFVWMKANYVPTTQGVATVTDFQQDPLPFNAPSRSLRSWDEVAAIEGVRDQFYDSTGRLTTIGKRFKEAFSLYNFTTPNVNAGNPNTIAVLSQLDDSGQQPLRAALLGDQSPDQEDKTPYAAGPAHPPLTYFANIQDATRASGALSLPGLGVDISALRINVTVRQGQTIFTLSAVVTATTAATTTAAGGGGARGAAGGGTTAAAAGTATVVAAPAPPTAPGTVATASNSVTTTASGTAQTASISYPFTILELTESDLDPAVPVVLSSTDSQTGQDTTPPAPPSSP